MHDDIARFVTVNVSAIKPINLVKICCYIL